jgi:iron complex outermembrane receptor protein
MLSGVPASARGAPQAWSSPIQSGRQHRRWGMLSTCAVGLALGVASASEAATGDAAPSTNATASSPSTVSEVVVTGTNIRGVAPVGSQIVTVDRSQIVAAGAVTTAQLLEETPQVTNLGISNFSVGQANGSGNQSRGTSIDLRGLGAYTTLTIVDGHRVVPQGGNGNEVDASIIPTIMLQRVDVLADGASATYGSDAIAGVVNMILRRNFNGAEVTAQGGVGDHYSVHQVDAIIGRAWDSGQFTLGVQENYNSALNGQYRPFGNNLVAQGGTDFRTTNCTPGNVSFKDPITGITYTYAVSPSGALLGTGTGAGQIVNKCDPGRLQDLVPEQQIYSTAFTFNQRLTDRIDLEAEGFYTSRNVKYGRPGGGGTIVVPSNNPFYVTPPAGGTVPNCPAPNAAFTCETVSYDSTTWATTPLSTGNTGYSRAYQINFGAKIRLFGDWQLEPYVTGGNDEDVVYENGGIVTSNINATALANGFNPFSLTQPSTVLLPPNPNQVLVGTLLNPIGGTTLWTGNLTLDGTLFNLAGGPVRAAVGYQYQNQYSHMLSYRGTSSLPTLDPVTGYRTYDRAVHSVFGELDVPLFGEGNARPGLERLDVDLAVRYDNYTDIFKGQKTFLATTTNPKFGVNWTPFEGMKVRASYGTSFRAPVFAQEFGNSVGLYLQSYPDYSVTGRVPIYPTLTGPAPGLKPETATTWSVGFDYQPTFASGLTLSLTYFNIDYKGAIANYLSNLTILSSPSAEAQLAGTGIIVRNPTDAYLAPFVNPTTGAPNISVFGALTNGINFPCAGVAPGGISPYDHQACANQLSRIPVFVDGRNKNLGVTLADGIDFQARYRIPAGKWGDFAVGLNGTYYTRFDLSATPAGTPVNIANTVFNPLRFRFRADVDWNFDGLAAIVYVNFANAYQNAVAPLNIPAYTTVDTHLAYNFGENGASVLKNLTLAVDVTNLLDAAPPFVNIIESPNGGGGGWDPVNANPIGRVVSFSLAKKF